MTGRNKVDLRRMLNKYSKMDFYSEERTKYFEHICEFIERVTNDR